jgi:SAM-dependent MidA family methyltransferase
MNSRSGFCLSGKIRVPMASWLTEKVRTEGGQIRFDRFMELALYDPEHGYYTRNISTVGRTGDFSTGATIGAALAGSIARWIKAEARGLGLRKIKLVELGGGSGQLAAGILRKFAFWECVNYQIVEISPGLQALQERVLRGRKIHWRHSIEEALDHADGEAIIISNEFVDAFPCRRFEKTHVGWTELFLKLDGERWQEILVHPVELPSSSSFDVLHPAGQRIEVHDAYRQWLSSMAGKLRRGAFLIIDYGGAPGEIYDRKPSGTIRAYFRHERIEGRGIYLRPGKQDLTADVNFDDLRSWGNENGLETIGFMTQAEFVGTWGRGVLDDEATEYMVDASGMGKAFKVLHLGMR